MACLIHDLGPWDGYGGMMWWVGMVGWLAGYFEKLQVL